MSKTYIALCTLLVAHSLVGCAQEREIFCKTDHISVLEPSRSLPIKIMDLRLTTDDQEGSWSALHILNSQSKTITQLITVINFYDQNGKYILAGIFAASPRGSKTPRLFGFPISDPDEILQSILPQHEFVLHSTSAITVTGCPSTARVLYLRLDGTDVPYYQSGKVRTDPRLIQVIGANNQPTLGSVMVTVRIDSQGHSTFVAIEPKQANLAEIRRGLGEWSFVPATLQGKPIETNLRVVVRFHKKREMGAKAWPENCFERLCKFAFLDIMPGTTPNTTQIWYGGLPISDN